MLRVTYHNTDVVKVDEGGTVTLTTDGFRTVTTKLRMNQAAYQFNLGYRVYQKDFEWYVITEMNNIFDMIHSIPFRDGMVINHEDPNIRLAEGI